MLGWLAIAVCGLATYLAFKIDSSLRLLALLNLMANFWTLGIRYNYGLGKVPSNYEHLVVMINMVTTCIGIILLLIIVLMR